MSHTPGPWHWVRYEGGTYDCLETDDGTNVVHRVLDDAGFMDIAVPNSADAALIERAWALPALLTAAEAVIREATRSEEIDGMPLVSWLALDQLQRAIAEAHGVDLPPSVVQPAPPAADYKKLQETPAPCSCPRAPCPCVCHQRAQARGEEAGRG